MADETVTAGAPGTFPALDTRDMDSLLHGLFERAKDNLTPGDLNALQCCAEHATLTARHIEVICNAVGCMVLTEDDLETHQQSGSFQSADQVSALLFAVAGMAGTVRGLLTIATAAENHELAAGNQRGASAPSGRSSAPSASFGSDSGGNTGNRAPNGRQPRATTQDRRKADGGNTLGTE